MSLTTRLFRAPAAVTKHSLRCFSGSRQQSNSSEDLLDILSTSKVAQSTKQSPIRNSLLSRVTDQAGLNERSTTTHQMIESERREQFQKQIYRRWQTGDIYSPHDLTGAEQKKWKFGRKKPQSDAFDVLGINPVSEYKVGRITC
jgi:small subunit ribosomal protein S18